MFRLRMKEHLRRTRALTEGYDLGWEDSAISLLSREATGFLSSLFQAAGYSQSEATASRNRLFTLVLFSLFFVLILGGFLLLPLVAIPPLLWYLSLNRAAKKRVDNFEKDYTALLLSLSAAVKTGLDPLVALSSSADLFAEESEVRKELELFTSKLESGATEEEALQSFARSIEHPDITLFRTALVLARREGSSLSHCLQRLARVTRQRQSFRRRTRSAVAMHKLSAIGIMVSAVIVLVIQFVGNPQALQKTVAHPLGAKIGLMGALLMVCGLGWMGLLARRRV